MTTEHEHVCLLGTHIWICYSACAAIRYKACFEHG